MENNSNKNIPLINALLILMIIGVIAVTAIIVLSSISSIEPKVAGTTAPKKEVKYQCAHNDQHLCNFLAVVEHRKPYFISIEPGTVFFIEGGQVEETIIETDGTNIQLTSKKTGQETRYVTQIGSTIYYRTEGETSWKTRPVTPDIVLSPMVMSEYLDKLQQFSSYKQIAEEPCDGKKCLIYQSIENNQELLIYFDTENYLLRRLVLKENGAIMEHVPDYNLKTIEKPI